MVKPLYLANKPRQTGRTLPVYHKHTGAVAAEVALADRALVEEAIAAAHRAAPAMRALAPFERQAILARCAAAVEARFEELARGLCAEAGKPIQHARGEVQRLVDTLRVASEEAVRIGGEVLELEISARAKGYRGMTRRVPVGVCGFITPFNFPLNLVAHKVAPALAAGCPFVLKPASTTPLGALILGEILAECGLPEGAFSILPCPASEAAPLVEDERVKLLSFTGSDSVGWDMKRRAGKKRVVLELGGNAACIVDEGVEVAKVVERLLIGAFYQSGQSCISVQRVLIHASLYDAVRDALVAGAEALVVGDPEEEATFIGPMISEEEAQRVERWIAAAVAAGGRLCCGGVRRGAVVTPAVLEDVPADQAVVCEEIFGPAVVLARFEDFEAALAEANASRFGLQAGVFTRDIDRAMRAWDALEVGGVVINDVPSWRVDHMPYGGVKDSGNAREGVRYAIESMTELRLLVLRS